MAAVGTSIQQLMGGGESNGVRELITQFTILSERVNLTLWDQ